MRGSRILLTSAVSLGTVVAATVGIASPAFARIDNGDYAGAAAPTLVAGETVSQQAPAAEPLAVESANQTSNQALPVTGGDIAEIAGVGFVLLGTGTVLVRRTRRRA